jgi:peptide chain release factor 3
VSQTTPVVAPDVLRREVARRRTFAIISHPDAGKTTLTEKILLYSGAVELAGSVRARKDQKRTTSDWMAIEQARGISVTSTALQFDYKDHRLNLLDTPGHQDFSEDTYRILMAVDCAIMVLDAAKGIEPQTLKLFKVCRTRKLPILTFINKLDQPGRSPLELLDEIERVLGIAPVARNWPVGQGPDFQGVYDLIGRRVLLFERTRGGAQRAPVQVHGLDDPSLVDVLGAGATELLREEAELVDVAGGAFSREGVLAGEVTPVFFGSALNNFGLETFLDALLDLAPPPQPRSSDRGPIDPADENFTGFVFKIQANMDPRHRDRLAFVRVCSGRYERNMSVLHPRLGRQVRLARALKLFARERETVEEAYAGDVVGLINPGLFAIGDSVCTGPAVEFEALPRFLPERFAMLRNQDGARTKQFDRGIQQLEEEGAILVLQVPGSSGREPILAAVGELQFDVVQSRLQSEYGVATTVRNLPYRCARWANATVDAVVEAVGTGTPNGVAVDPKGRPVVLFASEWDVDYFRRKHPSLELVEQG